MSAFVIVIVAVFVLGLALEAVGHFQKRSKRKPKNDWKLERITVAAIRPNKNNEKFDGVRFQARKRYDTISIDTPWDQCYALDPSSTVFPEKLVEYRVHAKEVVETLNANDKMLESYR